MVPGKPHLEHRQMRPLCWLISFFALTFTAQHGYAVDAQSCEAYGNSAIKQVATANSNHCPFDFQHDARWSTTRQNHVNWCLGVKNKEDVDKERQARAELNANCVRCNTYADEAVAAARKASTFGCNIVIDAVEDPGSQYRFSTNRAVHMKWCMGLSVSAFAAGALDKEEAKRNASVDQCIGSKLTQVRQCDAFVAATADDARKNAAWHCALGVGDEFSQDDQERLSQCMFPGNTKEKMEAEVRELHEGVQACEADRLKKASNQKRAPGAIIPKF